MSLYDRWLRGFDMPSLGSSSRCKHRLSSGWTFPLFIFLISVLTSFHFFLPRSFLFPLNVVGTCDTLDPKLNSYKSWLVIWFAILRILASCRSSFGFGIRVDTHRTYGRVWCIFNSQHRHGILERSPSRDRKTEKKKTDITGAMWEPGGWGGITRVR